MEERKQKDQGAPPAQSKASHTHVVKHCRHSTMATLEFLDASLPNDCAFCAHEQIAMLADALEEALREEEDAASLSGICVDTPWIRMAREALRAAGRLP